MIKEYKKLYRKNALLGNIQKQNNQKIIDSISLLIEKLKPNIIGLYKNLNHEIDISKIIDVHSSIKFSFPKIKNEEIEFYLYDKKTIFNKNPKYSFLEPNSSQLVTPDLIFVPGLLFDLQGYRLGFGKGHYDKYFANKKKLGYKLFLIGVSNYPFLKNFIPKEIHDIRMDYIIFDQHILKL